MTISSPFVESCEMTLSEGFADSEGPSRTNSFAVTDNGSPSRPAFSMSDKLKGSLHLDNSEVFSFTQAFW
jgi:hypothetical protein